MSEKCTLTPEEQAEAWKNFYSGLTAAEDEEINGLFSDFLIYSGRRPVRHCYCTNCGVFDAYAYEGGHNIRDTCPQCGAAVTVKALRYLRNGYDTMREKHNVVIFRKAQDGALLISAGLAVRRYVHGEFSGIDPDEVVYPVAETSFYERRRYYLAPGRIGTWKRWSGELNSFGIHWMERETPWEWKKTAGEPVPIGSTFAPQADGGRYFIVGRDKLCETALKYSQAETYFDFDWSEPPGATRDEVSYLVSYCKRPQLEMLVKLHHEDVIAELLLDGLKNAHLVNWRAKKPSDFFRMSKADYKKFARSGGTLEGLRTWREYEADFKNFAELMELTGGMSRTQLNNVRLRAKRAGRTLREVLRKMPRDNITLWEDYIDLASKACLDLSEDTVCFPRDLRQRHDALVEIEQYNVCEGERRAYEGRYRQLCQRYEFECCGCKIVVPTCTADIIREGRILHHCVGGYAKRHMEGKLDILFLRSVDDEETPLATIEMNGDRLVQIHGYRNDYQAVPASERYKDFVGRWLNWIAAGSLRDTAGNPIERKERTA